VPAFAVPIMPSKDLDATLSFYESLGFKNAGAAPSEWNYLIIRRGSVQLHFYGDPNVDPLRRRQAATSSRTTPMLFTRLGTRSEYRPIRVPGVGYRGPPADTEYGMREFALVDPSGNLLRVGSPPFI
jgi:catechol 2,3-dioxygenase-like lactoylglutathione lyase family enzyme